MKWLKKSNYHLESDPSRFFLCKSLVKGEWRYTLTDRNEWVMTGARKQCEEMAEQLERMHDHSAN